MRDVYTTQYEMHRGGKARSGKVKQRQFQLPDRQTDSLLHVKTSLAQPSPAQILYRLFFLTLYKDEATYKKKLIPHNVLATVQMATNYRLQTIGSLQTRIGQVYRSRGKERVGSAKTRRPPYFILSFSWYLSYWTLSHFFFLLSTVRYGTLCVYIFRNFP